MRNSRKKTKSKAGFRGVKEFNNCKIKRFNAYIRVDGKCMSLGMHETAEEASKVYEEAAKKYFGKFYAAGD